MHHTNTHLTRAHLSALLILALLLTSLLAACGGDKDDNQGSAAQPTSVPAVAQNTPLSNTVTSTPLGTATMALSMTQENLAVAETGAEGIMASAPSGAPDVALREQPAQQVAQATPVPDTGPTLEPQEPADMFFEDYGVNPFLDTEDDHLSTFAMDVDTASYTLTRSYLMDQQVFPPSEAIRPEEFINYFDGNYTNPAGDEAFAIHLDAAPAPFGFDGHYLFRVGLQGRYIAPEDRTPALLIFVIDVSGSMSGGNRLERVKESLVLLVGELRADDRVGIVVYSDVSRSILDPTSASNADTIMDAINALHTEGSTNVADGLRIGYAMAQEYQREGEITRVIVCSDGVGNVGPTGPDEILELVKDGVEDGITLSTIGFGMGNYNDVLMEQLANDGNGNYYYVDTLREARRVFVHNLTGTLQVIGYDAKVQVDFNPAVTDRYRLIGYENRAIADEDFRDDTVDAGEVGAGHSITALYEIALEGDDLDADAVIATVYIRYQDAETREVVEVNQPITVGDLHPTLDDAPASFRLHAAAAEFAELLRESYWAQEGSYLDLLDLAKPLTTSELAGDEDVTEFVELIRLAGRYEDR
ncbi:MAG: von Willebrand factor type A domain-containing protein [Anaerolineae bacterium]|nr:von Willebrand factor type A domain-containing protein [Anaerolineae bacterium]